MSKELNELITGIGQLVEGYTHTAEELDKLKSLYEKLKLEVAEEFEYPFEENETYFSIDIDGELLQGSWLNKCDYNQSCYDIGNVFHTRKEAEIEIDRRILLTKFRQFRDKCNGERKPDFEDGNLGKHYISLNHTTNMLRINFSYNLEDFNLFGYFRRESDAKRAIELFGDEIKRLWVDE